MNRIVARYFKKIGVIGWACLGLAWCCQAEELVPLKIKLPAPAFVGTPSDTPVGTSVEKPSGVPRPLLMVPPGAVSYTHLDVYKRQLHYEERLPR